MKKLCNIILKNNKISMKFMINYNNQKILLNLDSEVCLDLESIQVKFLLIIMIKINIKNLDNSLQN
jgi:hypothetical protein